MSKKKNKKKTLLDKLLYYFVIFILGALTGYIYEVIFYYITLGVLNNWGILYGPWLPIYGVGAVFLSMLKPFIIHIKCNNNRIIRIYSRLYKCKYL